MTPLIVLLKFRALWRLKQFYDQGTVMIFCQKHKYRKQRAFSMIEVVIILAMMTVFIGALFSAMVAGLRYWKSGRLRLSAQEALRESLDTMNTELRQAIPNPDPGTGGNPATGYISVDPNIDPTGLLYPNVHNVTGDYVEFTEPNFNNYLPSGENWKPEIPNNYKKVRYFTEGGILKRRVTIYNLDGSVQNETEANAVSLPAGDLSMRSTFLSPTFLEIEMTATLNKFSYTIKTRVKTGS